MCDRFPDDVNGIISMYDREITWLNELDALIEEIRQIGRPRARLSLESVYRKGRSLWSRYAPTPERDFLFYFEMYDYLALWVTNNTRHAPDNFTRIRIENSIRETVLFIMNRFRYGIRN